MFKLVILICSLSINPSDCTKSNASQIMESPTFANSLECNQPQPWMAKLAIQPVRSKEYPKTLCERIKS